MPRETWRLDETAGSNGANAESGLFRVVVCVMTAKIPGISPLCIRFITRDREISIYHYSPASSESCRAAHPAHIRLLKQQEGDARERQARSACVSAAPTLGCYSVLLLFPLQAGYPEMPVRYSTILIFVLSQSPTGIRCSLGSASSICTYPPPA